MNDMNQLGRSAPSVTRPESLFASGWRGLVVGLCTGGVVACFRVMHDSSFVWLLRFLDQFRHTWWIPLLWGVGLCGLAYFLGRLRQAVPLISGSGIPQTELTLKGNLPVAPQMWPRILLAKFTGSWLALLGGLSLGREGPCIQMGGAIGAIASNLWGQKQEKDNVHLIGGAAAGLAAAFGAPLAGILFAFEEMKCRITRFTLISTVLGAISAQWVAAKLFGLGRLFPFHAFKPPSLTESWTLLVFGVMIGFLGVGYNIGLLWIRDAEARQTLLPDAWRILPSLLVSGMLFFTFPLVLGGGDNLVVDLGTRHFPFILLILLLALKFGFSLYSYIGGVPGGLLMPLVCLGALWGHLFGRLLADASLILPEAADSFIIFGMAGYFAAIVRAPLTGIALVLEMSGAWACLPGTLLVGLLANLTADKLHCPPVYDSLKERIVVPESSPPFEDTPSQADVTSASQRARACSPKNGESEKRNDQDTKAGGKKD